MGSKAWVVFRKEMRDTLRDGRSVFAMFVFPFILYPALLLLMGWMQSQNAKEAKTLDLTVGIVGQDQLPWVANRMAALPNVKPIPLREIPASMEEAGVNAVLAIPPDLQRRLAGTDTVRVELLYKDADHQSAEAAGRMRPLLDDIRESLTLAWARSHGARAEAPPAFRVERKDISSKAEMGKFMAAFLIPYLLIFMIAAGSMQPAVDVTTGEKERSTLETILATAASRGEIVLGKCAAVIAAALTTAVVGIVGLWLNFAVMANVFPDLAGQSLEITIGPDKLVWIFLTVLPTAIFLSAVLVAIGCFARNMREGQTYATYVYIAAVFIGIGSFTQQGNPPLSRFAIPLLNTALLQREILTDTVQAVHAVLAVGSSVAVAAIMVVVALRLFSNESVLFRN